MQESKHLRQKVVMALLAVVIMISVLGTVTFAWYIYNTNAHITTVHVAAGTGVQLQISNSENGTYSTTTPLHQNGTDFVGELIPVSTDKISNGFQKVSHFEVNGVPFALASGFESATATTDFFKTSLWVRCAQGSMDLYLANILSTDTNTTNPFSTAVRVGLVVHKPEGDQEFIYEINKDHVALAQNNTKKAQTMAAGTYFVLDSTKTDGSVVEFTPLNSDSYCNYDKTNGEVSLKTGSVKLCGLLPNTPMPIDVYIWLEGCDEDCVSILQSEQQLKDLSLQFAGILK